MLPFCWLFSVPIAHLPCVFQRPPRPPTVCDPAERTPGSAESCAPGAPRAAVRVRAGCSLGPTSRLAGSLHVPFTRWTAPSQLLLSRRKPSSSSCFGRGRGPRLCPTLAPQPSAGASQSQPHADVGASSACSPDGRSPSLSPALGAPCLVHLHRTPTSTPLSPGRRECQGGGQLLGHVGWSCSSSSSCPASVPSGLAPLGGPSSAGLDGDVVPPSRTFSHTYFVFSPNLNLTGQLREQYRTRSHPDI